MAVFLLGAFFCSTIRLQFVGIFSSNNKNKLTCQQGAKNKSSKLQLLFWNNCSTVSTPTKKTLPLWRYYTAEKWTIFRTKTLLLTPSARYIWSKQIKLCVLFYVYIWHNWAVWSVPKSGYIFLGLRTFLPKWQFSLRRFSLRHFPLKDISPNFFTHYDTSP